MALNRSKNVLNFWKDEGGSMSPFAIMILLVSLMFSGMSLDSTNAFRMKYIMQTAADAAAHAAVMDLPDTDTALATALSYANVNLTSDSKNSAVTSGDVEIGVWDADTRVFTTTSVDPDAVRVTAKRTSAAGNALPTFLLYLAGFESWDIEVQSVAFRDGNPAEVCEYEGIITSGTFSMTSNNEFYGSYCIHAEGGLDLNNNNEFDNDNILSVGSFDDISWPSSTSMSSIIGRDTEDSDVTLTYGDIFQENSRTTPYVTDVEALADDYLDPLYSGQPDYINSSSSVIQITAKEVKYTDFIPGRIYEVSCGGSSGTKAQFFSGAEVDQVVIVSECKMQLGANSTFTDVVLVSTSTDSKSIYGSAGVQLGDNDSCESGGGVSLYTAGDFSSAASLQLYGAYISAVGEVKIAAQANAIAGLQIHAGGDVTFSANAVFGLCPDEFVPEDVVEEEYAFRIVQ